jgi:hypothetical protein
MIKKLSLIIIFVKNYDDHFLHIIFFLSEKHNNYYKTETIYKKLNN